jgi:hypothetical protein
MGVKSIFHTVHRPTSDFSYFPHYVSKYRIAHLIIVEVSDNRNMKENVLFITHDGVSIVTRLQAGRPGFDSR